MTGERPVTEYAALPPDTPGLDVERLRVGVHAWFCDEHHDAHGSKGRGRPNAGWACERGARRIAAEYARLTEAER